MLVTTPCPSCGTLNRTDLGRLAERPRCGSCRTPLDLSHPLAVDAGTFDAVLAGSEAPVLVDFYADWCGPCKMVAPIMDELARARMGSVLITKMDTDRNQATARRFAIASIPTVMVFKGGKPVAQQIGALPRQGYEALIDAAMKAA